MNTADNTLTFLYNNFTDGGNNNNNINCYIAPTPDIQINALYNKNMHTKKPYICNIILNLKSIRYR